MAAPMRICWLTCPITPPSTTPRVAGRSAPPARPKCADECDRPRGRTGSPPINPEQTRHRRSDTQPWPDLNQHRATGDDAAALPRPEGGWNLFAVEVLIPGFVADDPWFAGWCGVMGNLSDIAAMGGQATGITDMIWAPDAASARPVLDGLKAAAAAYGVPFIGGHTNLHSPMLNQSVGVTGRARRLISSFAAEPDDLLIAAIDLRGDWRPRPLTGWPRPMALPVPAPPRNWPALRRPQPFRGPTMRPSSAFPLNESCP